MLVHGGTIRIETERLILRKFTSFDAEPSYKNWAGDYHCVKYVDLDLNETYDSVKNIISNIIINYDLASYDFAIELKEINEVIGSIQLVGVNDYLRKCEIGFILGSKFWNKGYMSEAVKPIIDYAFNDIEFTRIEAYSTLANLPSEKVLLKSGLEFEGIAKKSIRIRDEFFDGKLFSIINSNYI